MEQTARITGGLLSGLAAWTRLGWFLSGVFFLVTLVSRIPFRSETLFAWDSANFAFALEEYNVAFHQPQPPGYPLYVASAKLLYSLGLDANTSYVLLSLAASSLAVWCLFILGWRLYGLQTGVVSALLLGTSSLFWTHGEVAYPYAFLALFSTLVLLLLTETKFGSHNLIVPAAFVLGLGAGFRPDLLLFLLPVWIYAWWGRSLRSLVVGIGVMLLVVLAWGVPTVQLSGGWEAYARASGEHYGFWAGQSAGLVTYLKSILDNGRTLAAVLYNGVGSSSPADHLLLGAILFTAAGRARCAHAHNSAVDDRTFRILYARPHRESGLRALFYARASHLCRVSHARLCARL